MRELQTSGAVALRVKKTENDAALVMIFHKRMDRDTETAAQEVQRILGLSGTEREFRIVYGSIPADQGEIALLTRSILEVLSDISATIEVPAIHVSDKRVLKTMEPEGEGMRGTLIRIRCLDEQPDDAFVAVPYRDRWYWIDEKDYQSKKLFSFLMFVMTLTESGGKEGAPVLTISAGG
jgi:hypothetical protein